MDIFRIIGRTLTVVVFLFLYWVSLFAGQSQGDWNQVRAVRNFYGAYKVVDRFGNNPRRILDHGGVNHGAQYSTIGESGKPTTYYTGDGGMGVAFRVLQSEQKPIEAVCVGVGVGTAAAWVGNRDRLTFVDIDPDIFTIAQEDFSFIGDAQARGATVDLVVGDGRKALEKFPKDAADLVVLDAFVGGGIPVHLLTQEALSLYTNLLNPEGILAVHVSSTTLNLEGLVETGLRRLGMKTAVLKSDGGKDGIGSCWVLASKSPSRVAALRAMGGGGEPLAKETIIWTDDFSPLFPIVR
jgi:SAM-dependent methyltransferase